MLLIVKDFFSKGDQIWMKFRIWSHLLNKSLMENFIFVQCDIGYWNELGQTRLLSVYKLK